MLRGAREGARRRSRSSIRAAGLGVEAAFGIAPASPAYFGLALLSDGELLGQRATFSFGPPSRTGDFHGGLVVIWLDLSLFIGAAL